MSDMDFDFGAEYAAFGDDLKGATYEGEYDMRVKAAKFGRTQKGKAMITVTLAFTSGPYAAKGKEILDNLYWSPENERAAQIFSSNLKVLGAPQDWILAERPSPQQICDRITGTVINVRLKPDEFNGQPTTRVSYRKTVSGPQGGSTGTASPTAAAAVSLDDDDDVDTTTGEVKEPAKVGAGAAGDDDPWA